MSPEFVHPNWHIIFIHYPLGLLTAGVLIELFSFLWRRSSVRLAGCWMILLGSLACIPALTLGLYAFRDVVSPQPIDDQEKWHNVVQTSQWTDVQWDYIDSHIWMTGSATVIFLLASIVWLACSNVWREKLYVPTLIVVIAALGLLGAGAWYSGEAVYVHGTAVGQGLPAPTSLPAEPLTTAPYQDQRDEYAIGRSEQGIVEPYIPPLQLHLLLAGITVAISLGALGASIRQWTQEVPLPLHPEMAALISPPKEIVLMSPATPGRLWFFAALFGISTALAGLWFTGDWRLTALTVPMNDPIARAELQRLFGHVLFGSSIVLLALLLAASTRFAPQSKSLTGMLAILLIVAVAGQLWLGILMLYDSNIGPLTGFN